MLQTLKAVRSKSTSMTLWLHKICMHLEWHAEWCILKHMLNVGQEWTASGFNRKGWEVKCNVQRNRINDVSKPPIPTSDPGTRPRIFSPRFSTLVSVSISTRDLRDVHKLRFLDIPFVKLNTLKYRPKYCSTKITKRKRTCEVFAQYSLPMVQPSS